MMRQHKNIHYTKRPIYKDVRWRWRSEVLQLEAVPKKFKKQLQCADFWSFLRTILLLYFHVFPESISNSGTVSLLSSLTVISPVEKNKKKQAKQSFSGCFNNQDVVFLCQSQKDDVILIIKAVEKEHI